MELQMQVNFWLKSSKDDLEAAQKLFDGNKNHQCLFFLHLAIEKVIKGLILKTTEKSPLPIHNLVQLANIAKIEIDKELDKQLIEISLFNIQARYDDYKEKFYKKATREFTTLWLEIGKNLYNTFAKKYE